MGYTTDFLGHIGIEPPLNEAEQQYLSAFNASRRYRRPRGPYEVPGNPAAEDGDAITDHTAYNSVGDGQPSLWCGWTPEWDGCCLTHDGREKFYGASQWMIYLIDHFLGPRGFARGSGLPYFRDFTFDHALNGIVAACRRDTRELYLIIVRNNIVDERKIVDPNGGMPKLGALPYEEAIDRDRTLRERRRPLVD